jgi:DNA polymerase-3 subunit gamma/tau
MSRPSMSNTAPRKLKDVIGQDAVVKSLEKVLQGKSRPHAFLFSGQYGGGKTTLSRILAEQFECGDVLEVDAATNNGIDAMRDITNSLRYHGFGAQPNKAIIIDECHSLSKQAWDSLLKSVEEPPPHVYWFFCTTVDGKVPGTITSRCLSYSIKPVRYDDLMDLLDFVAAEERLKTPPEVLSSIARACDGSPRMALTMLAKVGYCEDVDEAELLLEAPTESGEVIDLCRALMKGELRDWKDVRDLVGKIDQPAESIRIVIANYFAKCLMSDRCSSKEAGRYLDILAAFSKPFNASDKLAPLLLALGDYIFRD